MGVSSTDVETLGEVSGLAEEGGWWLWGGRLGGIHSCASVLVNVLVCSGCSNTIPDTV